MSEAKGTLEIERLSVSRGGHLVLHEISLSIARGSVTTLLASALSSDA